MTTRWKDKDPSDIITVEFNFTADATAVTTPSVTISAASGTDADPSTMLVGPPVVAGAIVTQRVQGGLNGVTYALQCVAYNGADRYSIEALLPVRVRPVLSSATPVYVTELQFEQRFGATELADLLAEGNNYVEAENDAAGLIDGYLASRYVLPLTSVPLMVKGWAADITRFKLWDERAPEEVRKRYEDALAQLKQLAQGIITLPPGTDGSKPSGGLIFGGYSNERVFTKDTLCGF